MWIIGKTEQMSKIVSGKKVLEEHSVFQIACHIVGLDTGGLVFLVSGTYYMGTICKLYRPNYAKVGVFYTCIALSQNLSVGTPR
jgi:hypothetical protein